MDRSVHGFQELNIPSAREKVFSPIHFPSWFWCKGTMDYFGDGFGNVFSFRFALIFFCGFGVAKIQEMNRFGFGQRRSSTSKLK